MFLRHENKRRSIIQKICCCLVFGSVFQSNQKENPCRCHISVLFQLVTIVEISIDTYPQGSVPSLGGSWQLWVDSSQALKGPGQGTNKWIQTWVTMEVSISHSKRIQTSDLGFPESCWHLQTPKPVWLEEEALETTGYLGQESSLIYSRLGFLYLWSQPKQNKLNQFAFRQSSENR